MKQGHLYRYVKNDWVILVVSNTLFNQSDHPFVSGICIGLDGAPTLGFPFEVPVYIADEPALVQPMALAPWRKDHLESIGRSLDQEDMLSVLDAVRHVLGLAPTGQHESCPDHPM